MAWLLIPIGLLLGGLCVVGIVHPQGLLGWVDSFWSKDRTWLVVTLRLALGGFLLYVAPECRVPEAVRFLGLITVLAAVGVAFAGSARVRMFVGWWVERPLLVIRAWSGAGALMGGFLVYAGS